MSGILKSGRREFIKRTAIMAACAAWRPAAFAVEEFSTKLDPEVARNWLERWQKNILSDAQNRYCEREMGEELGWLVSPFLNGFYYGYRATGRGVWLARLADWGRAWTSRAIKEPDGFMGWPKKGSGGMVEESLYTDSMLGEAMALQPMVLAARVILHDADLKRMFGEEAQGWLKLAENTFEKWVARGCWREVKEGGVWVVPAFGIDQVKGQWTADYAGRTTEGFTNPDNKQNLIAMWLLALHEATGKEVYRDHARKWWRVMKSRMKTRESGKYFVWNYWEPAGPWDYKAGGAPRHWVGVHPNGGYYQVDVEAIAVAFELDDFYTSDIQSYEGDSGLSNVPLTRITVDGYVSGSPGSDSDEVSLDIEMAISMAPALSGVIIYEGPNLNNYTAPDMVLNCMATNDAAKQLSCSWVFNIDATTVQTFQQFVAQGQSFFQASGDSGAYPGSPDPPTDDPYITSVGGTTLTTSSSGAWQSEKVWSWFPGQQYASSGGISSSNPIPSWQAPVSMASNQGSTTMRNLPDVALTADNVWVLYGGGQSGEYGGTSCAAPLWAGFTALVNQQAAINRRPPVGFLNPAFYALGLGTNYTTAFHDITSGNNTNLSSPNKFYAVPGYDLCTGWGTPNGTSMINALAPPATNPIISASAILTAESCLPTNGVMDPGETVTVNLMLTNLSPVATTNLVATLQAGSAVLQPTGPQYYGALVQGSNAVTLPFTFTANGACGQAISLVWQLQDGAANLGSITFNDNLGTLVAATTFTQNFDSVTIPALPAGWSSSVTGSQVNWVTINSNDDTPPNSVFAKDVPAAGVAYLYSPAIAIFSTNAQLTFRQDYLLAYHVHKSGSVTYYDGGVLDIAIGSGGFNDILSSGGSFVSGGYVGSLYSASGNPLAGREAWSGSSGGWITTVVNLPATAAGQNIQLRWDCATGSQNTYTGSGWAVDTISLKDAYYSCCNDSANLSVSQSEAPAQFSIGLNGVYTITLTNSGPDLAADVVVMDTLPPSVAFVSASPGGACNNGVVTFPLGSISSGGAATMNITVQPGQTGAITNTVTISTVTPPSGTGNATAVNITMVVNPQPITIVSGSLAVVPGSGLAVSVNSVSGWNYTLVYKNSLNDPAWTPLPASTVAGTGGVITLQDTSPAQSQRFYLILAN